MNNFYIPIPNFTFYLIYVDRRSIDLISDTHVKYVLIKRNKKSFQDEENFTDVC